jgi:hypothetical protein
MKKSVWVQGVLDIEVKDFAVVLSIKGKEIFRISNEEITRICSRELIEERDG